MRESVFQTRVLKKLRQKGVFFKIWGGGFQQAGIPDIIGCYKGKFVAIELKTDVGRLSDLQKVILKRIEDNGGVALVIRPNTEHILWETLDAL